jgi:hypothetical protein
MNCPPEIAAVLLDILTHGLLRARAAGWSGDAQLAGLEADHLHNIPALLKDYSPALLRSYWDVERPSYAKSLTARGLRFTDWNTLWTALRDLVEIAPVAAIDR